jgi:U3 small nucleolar ribonucleoprotein component
MTRQRQGKPSTEASRAAHRERQRRYRERLKTERYPESDDVQRAVFRAVRSAIYNVRRGRQTGDEQYDSFERALLKNIIGKAISDLELQGFSRRRVKRRLQLALIPPLPGPDELDSL